MERVRIKPKVQPYGGRLFDASKHRYPNGREVWRVQVRSSATAHKNFGNDTREYELDEVVVIPAKGDCYVCGGDGFIESGECPYCQDPTNPNYTGGR